MHGACKDCSFHPCNKSVNDETNTKVARDLTFADKDFHSLRRYHIEIENFKLRKKFYKIHQGFFKVAN